jgi:4-nitrophenyl phosphatase
MSEMSTIKPDPSVGAVLLGFDLDLNYKKLAKAFTYINSKPECHFLATNSDLTFPTKDAIYPGTGALLVRMDAH